MSSVLKKADQLNLSLSLSSPMQSGIRVTVQGVPLYIEYHQTSSISQAKSKNFNVSRLILQLP